MSGGDNPSFQEEADQKVSRTETDEEPRRKVSIVHVEEEPRRKFSFIQNEVERKISTVSAPKSILVNGDNFTHYGHDHTRSFSISTDERDRHTLAYEKNEIANSWWYGLCTKCRQKETGPGWEPQYWQSICPYPFCPTYRHMARVLALLILVLLAWGVIYAVLGEDSAPGGQLFDIAALCICANLGGWVFRMAAMPGLVGMLLVGILFQNVGFINIHGGYSQVVAEFRISA